MPPQTADAGVLLPGVGLPQPRCSQAGVSLPAQDRRCYRQKGHSFGCATPRHLGYLALLIRRSMAWRILPKSSKVRHPGVTWMLKIER